LVDCGKFRHHSLNLAGLEIFADTWCREVFKTKLDYALFWKSAKAGAFAGGRQ
jgi:hypothetical protein